MPDTSSETQANFSFAKFTELPDWIWFITTIVLLVALFGKASFLLIALAVMVRVVIYSLKKEQLQKLLIDLGEILDVKLEPSEEEIGG